MDDFSASADAEYPAIEYITSRELPVYSKRNNNNNNNNNSERLYIRVLLEM
jgi:hypothetical protein